MIKKHPYPQLILNIANKKGSEAPLDFTPTQSFSSHFLIHGENTFESKKLYL